MAPNPSGLRNLTEVKMHRYFYFWVLIGVAVIISTSAWCRWKPEYASQPQAVQDWYSSRVLTPEAAKRFGFTSCCAHSDVVKTKFHVNRKSGNDEWFWLNGTAWEKIPDDIIWWGESAPNGLPTLFAVGGKPTCFYPGEGGG